MYGEYELREVALTVPSERRRVEAFLVDNGLRMDPLDSYVGIFDSADELVAGGGLKGGVIKCVAVSKALRSESLANTLVSRLREMAIGQGHNNILVYTKPQNEQVFRSLAFHTVGRSARAVLMESDPRGVARFANRLQSQRREGRNGAVVMHCNPLTQGHMALIRHAAAEVDNLYVIMVSEDGAEFSAQERRTMLTAAVHDVPNATVIDGGQYVISAATFPSYFIKDPSEAADAQMDLDLDIFRRHIIPALNVAVRFVGSEPLDPLTRRYNERMKATLGIQVVEMPRAEAHGEAVSASLARRHIGEGKAREALDLVPPSTVPYILSHAATWALHSELELTPKPGLIDRHDNGAHSDMDFALMELSIRTLQPYFTELARLGMAADELKASGVRAIGIRAEQAMLGATRGVNTHRGALFSMGLAVACAAHCLRRHGKISATELQTAIATLAKGFAAATGTHGEAVKKHYNVGGAVAMAQGGYAPLFGQWLPFCRTHGTSDESLLRLLFLIMSTLDDTNIYYRCGKDAANEVKSISLRLCNELSWQAAADTNALFVSRNISPGGAADMLALTLFVHSVCCGGNDDEQ